MKGTLGELGRECSFSFMNLRSSSHEHLYILVEMSAL